jgi:hypothetical protein
MNKNGTKDFYRIARIVNFTVQRKNTHIMVGFC